MVLWLTVAVLALLVLALILEWAEPDVAMVAAVVLLVVGGALDLKTAFAGFANTGVLTVGALLVVAAGIQRAALLERASAWLLGVGKRSPAGLLLRLLVPTAALSAFINNTPIVAVLVPLAKEWSRRYDLSTSKLLMPISFAAMLGGTCTLLGTSTNLLASGILVQQGQPALGFFELAPVGLAITVVGLTFLIALAPRLLPDRQSMAAELHERKQEFIAEVKVGVEYPHLGKTLGEAGLRHLSGLYLFQILRGGSVVHLADAEERVQEGDRLFFVGIPATLVELLRTPGLVSTANLEFDVDSLGGDLQLFEATVSNRSPYLGRAVRDIEFRQRYDAAILAIDRHGERVAKKLGDVLLKRGDTLLLIGEKDFLKTWQNTPHFDVITTSAAAGPAAGGRPVVSLLLALAMLGAIVSGAVPPLLAAASAALLMVFLGCLPIGDARRAIDMQVMLVLGASLAMGLAVTHVGLADGVAGAVRSVSGGGALAVLAVTMLLTVGASLVTSNQAAVGFMIPIAIALGAESGVEPRRLVVAVIVAASLSFATPMGYTTNVLVWGAGGYRFLDYVRLGAPLTLLTTSVAVLVLYALPL
jgi:di/tricarboxylate transporter